jgi:hypothetical protein
MSYAPAMMGPVGTVRGDGAQFLSKGPSGGASASVGVMGPMLFSAKVSLLVAAELY